MGHSDSQGMEVGCLLCLLLWYLRPVLNQTVQQRQAS